MSKRTPFEVQKSILGLLLKENVLTYTKIQTKLGTNYDSVRNNLEQLESYELIETKNFQDHPENGHDYREAKLTSRGREIAQKLRKKD